MTERPENPPAFPRTGDQESITPQEGMTLRDWFAGMALQGLLALERYENDIGHNAVMAYALAEDMLTERAGLAKEES